MRGQDVRIYLNPLWSRSYNEKRSEVDQRHLESAPERRQKRGIDLNGVWPLCTQYLLPYSGSSFRWVSP
jgi:hypothetical protein